MFRLAVVACLVLPALTAYPSTDWYKNALVYQIYPRSFKDNDGDGIGDIGGIISKLEHVADIGAKAVWLSPIYKSPQVDFGYDISNFTDIEPDYGTLWQFDRLLYKAKYLGLKVIMDFVPNHSSDQHPWFKKSVLRIKPYDEYYVWRDARIINGTRYPPNNWLSNFQGSAWQWNNVRKQYYLHQFAAGQPDLNYRSAALNREMKQVLSFWLDRGVDGFRIDAINHLVEDARFLDEPRSNATNVPKDDYDSLSHIYTRDQKETYNVLRSWRKLMDEYANRTKTDVKLIVTEAYTSHELTMKYYDAGSMIPFNFMFMRELNNKSTAADFKTMIDRWLSSVPKGNVANWVVGNHDNHRVATRFGRKRADQISMLAMMLPGVAVVYNGDEIGMEDRRFTYYETVDPAGCNAGPIWFASKSRDPERTPYQWDNTTSAGFSSRSFTWLPVNSNYKTLNLAAQKQARVSHYKVFKDLSALRNTSVLREGLVKVDVLENKVLAVVRRQGQRVALLLINFSDTPVRVVARPTMGLPAKMIAYTSSVGSNLQAGSLVATSSMNLPAAASVVYTTPSLVGR